jgi:hypothetical protein
MATKSSAINIPVISRLFLALLFSVLFIFSPWCQLEVGRNPDVQNYLRRIDNILHNRDTIVDDMSLLQYLLHEPVWGYIQTFIGEFFYDPLDGLEIISFFSIFIYSFFLFGRINVFVASFFLFNPMIIDLVMAQIRSAFAMALLLIALMVSNKLLRLIILITIAMIHSLTSIFFIVYVVAKILESKKSKFTYSHKQLGMAALFFGLILSVVLGAGGDMLLGAVGDRRADDHGETTSFVYLIYWMVLAVALPFIPRYNNNYKECWTQYYSITLLSLPLLMAVFGANGVRFVPLSFPIFLYSLSMYTTRVKMVLITSLFSYQLIQYFYWLKIF